MKIWQFYLRVGGSLDLEPDPQSLSTLSSREVRHLLMGGQACVFYGAAEFSRNCDIVVVAEHDNFSRLTSALEELEADCGTPTDVGISDADGSLTLTCEVMNFNVNQNLEEVVSADVTLKPTQSSSGSGMNVGSGTP